MRNPPANCGAEPYECTANTCPGKKHQTGLGWCCDKCGISVEPPASAVKAEKEPVIPVDKDQLKLFGGL